MDESEEDPALSSMQRHSFELQAIRQAYAENQDGNVLVVVKFPENTGMACDARKWTDFYQRMPEAKLRASNSSKILAMFEPAQQRRFRRRLGMENQLPVGIDVSIKFPLLKTIRAKLLT